MIALRRHTPDDYHNFPDIDKAGTGVLTTADQACLDEIGVSLGEQEAQHRFGITLLHRHFAIAANETMVESFDARRSRLTLRPERRSVPGLIATSFCFSKDHENSAAMSLVALEYCSDAASVGYEPLCEADMDTLGKIRRILVRHGKLRRFGVRLLHDNFHVDDHVRFETCDESKRSLHTAWVSRADPRMAHCITTVFRWRAANENIAPGCVAAQVCEPWQQCHAPTGTHQVVSGHRKS